MRIRNGIIWIPDPQHWYLLLGSVAEPGCLAESEFFPSRNHIKEFKYFNPKKLFLSYQKYDPGCSSRIRILIFHPSRISDPGVKRHRIQGSKGIGSGSATLLLGWLTSGDPGRQSLRKCLAPGVVLATAGWVLLPHLVRRFPPFPLCVFCRPF